MMVRSGRAAARQTAQKPKTYQTHSFPSPTLGWVANGNLALPQPGGACVLENWFPTATGAVIRRGSVLHATLGAGNAPVRSLFTYSEGSNNRLFGATDAAIYDVEAVSSPSVHAATRGDWSVVQFATAGGTFLRGVNGKDTPFVYDGTTWSTTPAITGAVPENLKFVWSFKNRLFFIEKESLNAWYLPVDSIGGAAVKFPMGGLFSLGGSLMFGASWSRDAGDGLNAMCVFITTEGEVAVFQGSDPGNASTWSQVGVYRVGKPLGPKAFHPAGGDLVIATDIGDVPLSMALQKDYAALSPSAISAPIEDEWNNAVLMRSTAPWHSMVWSSGQMKLVALPTVNEQPPVVLVVNTRTGAWGKFTGWDATCLAVFKNRLFFGSQNGRVVEAMVSGTDEGKPYTATFVPLFDQMGVPGLKTATMARAVLRTSAPAREKLSIQSDYEIKLPVSPDASPEFAKNTWDVAIWGEAVWGAAAEPVTQQPWRTVYGEGDAIAPALQLTSGSIAPLDTKIVRLDVAFTTGDVIV